MAKGFDADTIRIVQNLLADSDIGNKLEQLKQHHEDSYKHCIRVSLYCASMGKLNSYNPKGLEILTKAALLHDYGKIFVSLEILTKSGKLTEEEFKKIKEHPRRTFIKLDGPKFKVCRKILISHHEYQDCSYPRNNDDRRGKNRQEERRIPDNFIEECAQILAITDIFDALYHRRAYKKEMKQEEALHLVETLFKGDKKFVNQLYELVDGT